MAARGDGWCRVVYFCAARHDGQIRGLHHSRHSPPDTESVTTPSSGSTRELCDDIRALLDEDIGGFTEVYASSRAEDCRQKLESWANSSAVVVLIEFSNVAHDGALSPSFLKDGNGSYEFLRALTHDIQGARYQRHVMPFALIMDGDLDKKAPQIHESVTTSCLDAGAIDVIRHPMKVRGINHLVGHVKTRTRPRAQLLGTPMAQNLVDSIHDTSEPGLASHRPDVMLSAAQRTAVEAAVCSWRFPAQDLNIDELTYGALFMLEHALRTPELQPYGIPRSRLMAFILGTRRQYKHSHEVSYHNWRHAVDVTQSIFYFLLRIRLCPALEHHTRPMAELSAVERLLTPLDGLILLVSAVGHDVGHPGVNNAFLVACNHPLAQMYNDKSVLENYHCAAYSQLLRRHWPALGNIAGFRSAMISVILATDMQRHFEYMSRLGDFTRKVRESERPAFEWPDKEKEHGRELLMSLIIKAADISNVARPFEISATWAKILMDEFARQGELESELQIPTCLFGGPPDTEDLLAAAESQRGFIDLFGVPLFKGIAEVMPTLSCSVNELDKNHKVWKEKIEKERQARERGEKRSALSISAVGVEEADEVTGKHKSEPNVMPTQGASPSDPSTPRKKHPVTTTILDHSPSRHLTHEHRRPLSVGVTFEDGKRSTTTTNPLLGTGSTVPLSPPSASSRRSSKDIALDQLQQLQHLSALAQQNIMPGSRRGSADATGWQLHQSYPSSRRGSKDESLTTILVTSSGGGGGGGGGGVTPNRRTSPLSQGQHVSQPSSPNPTPPLKANQFHPPQAQAQKGRTTARTFNPSSRSNATNSTATTTTTTSNMQQPSPSTHPSSLADPEAVSSESDSPTPPHLRQTSPIHHQPHHRSSIPSTEDPFMGTATWPNDPNDRYRRTSSLSPDGTADEPSRSTGPPHRLPASPPPPPWSSSSAGFFKSSSSIAETSTSATSPILEEPPGGGRGLARMTTAEREMEQSRESRSRSRLRGLRFWRKSRGRDVEGSSESGQVSP